MTAVFRSASGNPLTGDANIVVNKPAGTVDNDVLIASISARISGGGLTVSTVPTGWTLVATGIQTVAFALIQSWIYRKVASGEGASWTWVLSGTPTGGIGAAAAFSSGNTTTPVAAISGAESSGGTTVTTPSVTTTEDNQLILGIAVSNWAQHTWTAPTGTPTTTERLDSQSGSGAHETTVEFFTYTAGATGPTTARAATVSGDNDDGIGWQIALKNAASGSTIPIFMNQYRQRWN